MSLSISCSTRPFITPTGDTETFDRVLAINVRGPMLCFKYAAQQMVKQGRGGRLIGASSAAGREGKVTTPGSRKRPNYELCSPAGFPMLSAYSASKFALRGLMQSAGELDLFSLAIWITDPLSTFIAKELAEYNITVNCYAPGTITTGMGACVTLSVSFAFQCSARYSLSFLELQGSGAEELKAKVHTDLLSRYFIC